MAVTVSVGNGIVSVWYEGREYTPSGYDWRRRYAYRIAADGWEYVGNDLQSGVGAPVNEDAAMGDLLSFLSACAESRQYAGEDGENSALFPPHVGEWSVSVADEIALAGIGYQYVGHYG